MGHQFYPAFKEETRSSVANCPRHPLSSHIYGVGAQFSLPRLPGSLVNGTTTERNAVLRLCLTIGLDVGDSC